MLKIISIIVVLYVVYFVLAVSSKNRETIETYYQAYLNELLSDFKNLLKSNKNEPVLLTSKSGGLIGIGLDLSEYTPEEKGVYTINLTTPSELRMLVKMDTLRINDSFFITEETQKDDNSVDLQIQLIKATNRIYCVNVEYTHPVMFKSLQSALHKHPIVIKSKLNDPITKIKEAYNTSTTLFLNDTV